jgi:hypothetical protein
MKRFKMDKWGQLPFLSEPVQEDGPWTVRSVFLALIPITMLVGLVYTIFFQGQ